MKPPSQSPDALELFQAHFHQLLNPAHPLVKLAGQIQWEAFEKTFAACYCEDLGAPAKATRLMVGLHYLKHAFNESDESVVARWVENPYWQYFCGFTHLQHRCPIHPTSMTRWRNRVGQERLAELLKQTIVTAVEQNYLPERELKQVNVDTTVQEKNITHPTDSKLLLRAIVKLSKAARQRGLVLRQSYLRVGRRAAVKAGRYAHARQFRRMGRELRRLRTYVGRLIRDIQRKAEAPDESLTALLERCQRVRDQRPGDSNKLYSLHEPETRCISKGKASKRYEFGQKIALATTNRRDWFVAARLCPGNPYDGHTLSGTLQQVESITGVAVSEAYVDKGYRGHDYTGTAAIHIAGSSSKHLRPSQRRRRKRRSAIEPKIGHLKSENRMSRCYLKGLIGDATNALLAAAGANLRKLLRLLPCALRRWLLGLLRLALAAYRPTLVPFGIA
jgi:IS5 family transposase